MAFRRRRQAPAPEPAPAGPDRLLEWVVDTADVWINTLDLEARVGIWNRAAESISGYGRDEVAGRADIWSRLYPDEAYRAGIAQKVAAILQGGAAVRDIETTILTKTGESRIISWCSRSLKDERGVITGSLAIGRDITELRRAEDDLQRTFALQNLILEHNVLGIAYVQERHVVWANPRISSIMGLPVDQLVGASVRLIYPDEATFEEVGRRAYPILARGEAFDTRLQMKRINGQHYWCRLLGLAVDPEDPQAGSVWLVEDISDQVAAEGALAESEERFRGAFEGTQDALFLLTSDGIFDCNQKALEIFGFSHKAELIRHHPADLSPARQPDGEDSRIRSTELLQRAFAEGGCSFRWQHRRQDGRLFWAEVLMSSFRMGRRKVVQACLRDITERLAAEEKARETETRFRMLFERYADGVVLLDSHRNVFVDCNPAALAMLRCTREELVGQKPAHISPEFQPDGRSSREKGQEMLLIALREGSHRFRWTHRCRQRGDFEVDVLLTPIQSTASPLVFATWREIR